MVRKLTNPMRGYYVHLIFFNMGGAVGRARRVLRMYNIDNRVNKVLSKEKPTPAPRYPIDVQAIDTESKLNLNNF